MGPSLMTLIAWLAMTMWLAPVQDVPSPSGARQGVPGEQPRTESELRAILETRPSDLAPYRELAYLVALRGRVEDGEQVLRQALGVHPQTGAVYAAMVMLYGGPTSVDQRERLAGIAEEWVKAEPTNAQPLVVLGRLHLLRAMEAGGRSADALAHLDRGQQVTDDALRLSPNDPATHMLRLALAKSQLGLTEDPSERARLQEEINVWTQELAQIAKTSGIGASRPAAAVAPPASALIARAVRVGGNIQLPTKIKDAKPAYPAEALEARVQGVVIFEVVIDEAGKVADARVLRSIPLLDRAAVDAVRQWEFAPTLLNGYPVPVIMTVTVQFNLPSPQ